MEGRPGTGAVPRRSGYSVPRRRTIATGLSTGKGALHLTTRAGLILLLAALMAFCARSSRAPAPSETQSTVMRSFTKADHDRSCSLAEGERFEVRLPENPTTGYTWAAVRVPEDLLGLESETFESGPADPRISGRGGTKVFVFKALTPGSGEIELRLRRPWEKGVFIDSFVLKLTIGGTS
jgi:predicted secreted protein